MPFTELYFEVNFGRTIQFHVKINMGRSVGGRGREEDGSERRQGGGRGRGERGGKKERMSGKLRRNVGEKEGNDTKSMWEFEMTTYCTTEKRDGSCFPPQKNVMSSLMHSIYFGHIYCLFLELQ